MAEKKNKLVDFSTVNNYDYATDTPAQPEGWPAHQHKTLRIVCAGCGRAFVAQLRCSDRTCTECRRKSYYSLLRAYLSIVKQVVVDYHNLRLMTLTVENIPISSTDFVRRQCNKILRYFDLMRKRKYYRNVIRGGIRSLELVCKDGQTWNLHLHILFEGSYIPVCCQDMKDSNNAYGISYMEKEVCPNCKKILCLRRDWIHYTKTSPVVDIKKAFCIRGGLKYVMKYLGKPATVGDYKDAYNLIMKGRRLVQPFGTWYDMKLEKEPYVCPDCGSVHWISEFQVRLYSKIAWQFYPDKPTEKIA